MKRVEDALLILFGDTDAEVVHGNHECISVFQPALDFEHALAHPDLHHRVDRIVHEAR